MAPREYTPHSTSRWGAKFQWHELSNLSSCHTNLVVHIPTCIACTACCLCVELPGAPGRQGVERSYGATRGGLGLSGWSKNGRIRAQSGPNAPQGPRMRQPGRGGATVAGRSGPRFVPLWVLLPAGWLFFLGLQTFSSGGPKRAPPRAELEACSDRTKIKEQRRRLSRVVNNYVARHHPLLN
jgi:hypothetical protein